MMPSNYRKVIKNISDSSFRYVNPDFLRLAKSLQSIVDSLGDFDKKKTVAIIGDGFGTFGCLLKGLYPCITIIQINLGRQLLFDFLFSKQSNPKHNHVLLSSLAGVKNGSINFLPAEQVTVMNSNIDLFVSIESFQEMDLEVIKSYFRLIRKQKCETHLYSANRVSKRFPDGSIVRLEEYGWRLDDVLIKTRAPWWLNWGIRRRPPFIFKMEGIIEERLVLISSR